MMDTLFIIEKGKIEEFFNTKKNSESKKIQELIERKKCFYSSEARTAKILVVLLTIHNAKI